jgi:hypothetical protein
MATTGGNFNRDSIVTPTLPMGEQDSGGINNSINKNSELKFSAFDPTNPFTTQYSGHRTPLNLN